MVVNQKKCVFTYTIVGISLHFYWIFFFFFMFGVKWKISINKNSFLNLKKLLKRGGKCFLFSKNKNQFLLFLFLLLFSLSLSLSLFNFMPLLPLQFVATTVTQLTPPLPLGPPLSPLHHFPSNSHFRTLLTHHATTAPLSVL